MPDRALELDAASDNPAAANNKRDLDEAEDVELLREVLEELGQDGAELAGKKLAVFNTINGGGGSCAPSDNRPAHVYIRGFTEYITQECTQ